MSEENNLSFWEKVEKTDPKTTKQVNSGGRKITAINAQHQIKKATFMFGKYGEKWGLKSININYINNLVNDQVLAVSRAVFYYPNGEFEIGSSIFVQSWVASRSYNKVDEDFLKKLETDMLTKSLSKLGFNADVFMGRFDDNKYIYNMNLEFGNITPSKEQPKPQDRKQALTLEGFEFLKTKGTKEQIKTALDDRRMSGDQREVLKKLYESKKNS